VDGPLGGADLRFLSFQPKAITKPTNELKWIKLNWQLSSVQYSHLW